MAKFFIKGGSALKGKIEVCGAKNSATPILASTLLTDEECLVNNVPRIGDVLKMLEIMKSLGAEIEWLDEHKVRIRAKNIDPSKMDFDLVCQLRSSILLMGSLLARFGEVRIPAPGGCQIGARPLDAHLFAFADLGTEVKQDNSYYYLKRGKKKKDKIIMSEFSVTATENILIALSLSHGKTLIKGAAAEHYVQDLAWFLQAMGANIKGVGTHELLVEGIDRLKGVKNYQIMPDPIEVGTFLSLAGATRSNILIKNTVPEFLETELKKFEEANLKFNVKSLKKHQSGNYQVAEIEVLPSLNLKAVKKVHTMPYPGFTADLLPPFAVMMTQAQGTTLIHDWMFEGRLKYIDELIKMGANATICDPHRALIVGPTPLFGREITSFDLRAGATLIIAALLAQGESVISNIEQVERGYEKIDERLRNLGAEIKRID